MVGMVCSALGSLSIPVVLWGRTPPSHDISCILVTKEVKTVVSGSRDGHICVWDFDPPKLKVCAQLGLLLSDILSFCIILLY